MPGVRVDRVLTEGTRVVGVQAGDDELRAHVVVAADGVNSFIAQDAGLRKKPPLHHLAVGVKAVVSLPRKTIEDRFTLTGDEGAAIAVVGDCTEGVGGGGFLYTNIDSLSIGIVVRLDDLTAKKKVVTDIFDHFLEHRFIAPYLEGGELLEYGCHLVAEGGLDMVGDIVMDGMVVVGDAAGLTLNTGLTVRGMDLAVGSAVAAAEAIGSALDQKNTSTAALAAYREKLFASYVGKDMETYAKAPHFLETDRMYKEYGELLANVLYGAQDPGGAVVLRITGQARVVDPRHTGVRGEAAGELGGRRLCPIESHGERAEAPERQERLEVPRDRAVIVPGKVVTAVRVGLLPADDRAQQQVRVAADELRCRVEHDVRAEIELAAGGVASRRSHRRPRGRHARRPRR